MINLFMKWLSGSDVHPKVFLFVSKNRVPLIFERNQVYNIVHKGKRIDFGYIRFKSVS